jgi:hypothetical protein
VLELVPTPVLVLEFVPTPVLVLVLELVPTPTPVLVPATKKGANRKIWLSC